jgi:hypothetical protein
MKFLSETWLHLVAIAICVVIIIAIVRYNKIMPIRGFTNYTNDIMLVDHEKRIAALEAK